ncbi:hypothetical protein M081_1956 [Bacteroides fragilis str. 3998 T(B) 4]|nr:hypothetical protein M081_1956 [Bacteroides fragilis str. 3998 T(B) 4]
MSGNHITFFNRIDRIRTHAYTSKHKHNYIMFHSFLLAIKDESAVPHEHTYTQCPPFGSIMFTPKY